MIADADMGDNILSFVMIKSKRLPKQEGAWVWY